MDRVYKPSQARYKRLWALAGCTTMWRTWWLRKNGSVPSDSAVEDIELAWKAQKDYLVNYTPDATCFTENLET
jgi:cellulose synthase/poly-beta-1,6-N-acetylglucosamine synthase-like glycosyltransferase